MTETGATEWKVYRTRFLVRARQLTDAVTVIDPTGREQIGCEGDYLVECSDGSRRIAPRQIFEDIYVELENAELARAFTLYRGRRSDRESTDPRQVPLFGMTG